MSIKKVLVADDDPLIRSFLYDVLTQMKKEVTLSQDGNEALAALKKESFDLLITDMKMPGKDGLTLLKAAKKLDPKMMVLFMTAYATIENAVEAMRQGAFHYLIKPFSLDAFETVLAKAEEQVDLLSENFSLRQEIASASHQKHPKMIAESPFMKSLTQDLKKIAKSNASVFISGESGSGKEVIAQAVHAQSHRKEQPFITVNCPAINESLLESEFFGHEKGAFTGALQKKMGRFELANHGSLLLDEVTEIPLGLQAKLLRAIQEQSFERVGSEKTIHVDVRLISTSNRDIKEAINQKILREDLFYRLNVIPIHLLPLRERKEDILPLADYFLERFCLENQKELKKLTATAKNKMMTYRWPGNVRELANIIERAVVLDRNHLLTPEDLFGHNQSFTQPIHEIKTLEEMEKTLILKTLQKVSSKTEAAKELGITYRTLQNKLKRYGNF
jgi:two-component system, NtrC family, response regulator AtoC